MSDSAALSFDPHLDPGTATGIPNKKLLWWAFLASDCMFFGALISTHLVYRLNPPPGNAQPTQIFDIELTSFSTFILLMSSLLMALAVNAIQRGQVRSMRTMLLGTLFFGCIFLGGQVYEFAHFVTVKKLTLSSSLFGSTFYTLTGTHGAHVAIGVLLLALLYVRSFQPAAGGGGRAFLATLAHLLTLLAAAGLACIGFIPGVLHLLAGGQGGAEFLRDQAPVLAGLAVAVAGLLGFARSRAPVDFGQHHAINVEAIGLYWHFVDIVWIVIFTAVYLIEYL